MDHPQFSEINLTQLEQLFTLLVKNTTIDAGHLTQLAIPTKNILPMVSMLQDMGLFLQVDNQSLCIKRLNHVDKIKSSLLAESIRQLNINKPLHYHFYTTSTNQLARESNQQSIHIAEYQSAGKGRLARKWITPVGQSIALSISHDLNIGLEQLAGLNIVAGAAILKTAQQYDCQHLRLKWPNDVIGQQDKSQGKVAGILIEANGNNKNCRVIIGIGINWQVSEPLFTNVEQDCMNIGISTCDRQTFIATLIKNIDLMLTQFIDSKLKFIAPIWHKYDAFVGHWVNLIDNNHKRKAQYLGINDQGMLKVAINQQIKLIASGEVSIRKID